MANVYLMLGSNQGNRMEFLEKAKADLLIPGQVRIINQSSVYETEPWGFEHETQFLNQAVAIETALTPEALLTNIRKIETSMGRIRTTERYTARNIDIDILLFDNLILNTNELTIPHPEMAKRRFVLKPLAEIAPHQQHPVFRQTILELLSRCEDSKNVVCLTN